MTMATLLLSIALLASSVLAGPLNPTFHENGGFRDGGGRGIIRHSPHGPFQTTRFGRPSRPTPRRSPATFTSTVYTTLFTTLYTPTPFPTSSFPPPEPSTPPTSSTSSKPIETSLPQTSNSTTLSNSSSTLTTSSRPPLTNITSPASSSTIPSSSNIITTSSSAPITSSAPATVSTQTTSACSATATLPGPGQAVAGCSEYYVAESGDNCNKVAAQFGITTNTFMAWNPAVGANCTNMIVGAAYCVQVCGNASLTSITTSFTPLPSSTISSAAPSLTQSPDDNYHAYCGSGSVSDGWPSMDQWLDFNYLFKQNTPNMKLSCANWGVPNDSDEEIANLETSIHQVANVSGIDARFILAIVMQESTGCVRVITTEYSHANPGLMQSYQGTGTCNTNQAPLGFGDTTASGVTTPCPQSEIYQMVLDGTNGTASGPGLRQNYAQQNMTGATGYYRTAKIYNGGINSLLTYPNSLQSGCCTQSYASDVANRLTGWVSAQREFTC